MANPESSVLIAGAGPTGLVLAIILIQSGVSVRIIDKQNRYRIGSRGTVIQPRTLELYDVLGILPDIQSLGEHFTYMNRYVPGKTEPEATLTFDKWVDPTPDSNSLSVSQDRHQAILRAHLERLGCAVELGSELLGLEQAADHVVAHIVNTAAPDDGSSDILKEEHTRFDWLIGADSARSIVRKTLGIDFIDMSEGRPQQYIALGDIEVEDGDVDHSKWHMWSAPHKYMVLRPNSGGDDKRFTFTYGGRPEHLADKTITREEFLEEFYKMTGRRDIKFGATGWVGNWQPSIRVAERIRVGRVFIAGDAAHCHSATGGQGINSSVQDAANLAWKLALVHKGLAPDALLDTYAEERLRVIKQMIALTTALYDRTIGRVSVGDVAADKDAWERKSVLRMLEVNYAGSSIVCAGAGSGVADGAGQDAYADAGAGGGMRVAYRAPDAPGLVDVAGSAAGAAAQPTPMRLFNVFRATVHTILLFGCFKSASPPASVFALIRSLPRGVTQTVCILPANTEGGVISAVGSEVLVLEDTEGHAHELYGVPADELTIVVVRPDGLVGAAAHDAQGVEAYFRKIVC